MKVIKINSNPKIIKIIPRIDLQNGDEIKLIMRNEISNVSLEVANLWQYVGSYLSITLLEPSNAKFFKLYDKYQIKVFKGLEVIYEGKIEFVKDTDVIQDLKTSSIVNNKIKY